MKKWTEPDPLSIPAEFLRSIEGNSLVAETLIRHGFKDIDQARGFLDPSFYSPTPGSEFSDIGTAVDLLAKAIRNHKPILVWGDFDVDGQTATTVLVSALRSAGAHVQFYIPVRATESHGIHSNRLEELITRHGIQLLLTCDTGITACDEVLLARKHHLEVIITDHHQPAKILPDADAIINPRLLPANHPLSTLPGVGVAYKLIESLYAEFNLTFTPNEYLDLTALGIVADVAGLIQDTRYLLQLGIRALQTTHRAGLLALYEQAEISPVNIDEELIAFSLAPRLNALGRLADANRIVDFFTTRDQVKARITAIELEALNARRKLLTDQVLSGALSQLERDPGLLDQPVLVLSNPAWPGGIIGIVANRLVEYYGKPVVLLTTPPGEIARGSARSISGINIADEISKQSSILVGFGGHPMAAGLSIHPENIDLFRRNLIRSISSLDTLVNGNPISIAAWMQLSEINLDFVQDIQRLAPFGAANPLPVFASTNLKIVNTRQVGRYQEHRVITISDSRDKRMDVIWWQGSSFPLPANRFDLAFTLRNSDYRGQPMVQMTWVDHRSVESLIIDTENKDRKDLEIIDLRGCTEPESLLQEYLVGKDTVVWSEVVEAARSIQGAVNRKNLSKADRLIIWSIPPGTRELKAAIRTVDPTEIILFSINPQIDEYRAFINRLIGLVKYAIRVNNGNIHLLDLACATAQRTETIYSGLRWLAKNGFIDIQPSLYPEIDDYTFTIKMKDIKKKIPDLKPEDDLSYLLDETSAFRKFYLRADNDHLLESDS